MLWRVVIDKERFRSDQVVVMERNEDPVNISTPKSMLVSSLGGSCTVLKGKRDGKAGNAAESSTASLPCVRAWSLVTIV